MQFKISSSITTFLWAFPVCLHVVFLVCLPCVQIPSAYLYGLCVFFFIHFSLCIRFSMRSHCVNFASVNLVLFLVSFTVTLTELKSELILMMIGRKITVLKTDHISVGIYRKVKMVISKPFLHGLDWQENKQRNFWCVLVEIWLRWKEVKHFGAEGLKNHRVLKVKGTNNRNIGVIEEKVM